MMHLPSCDRLMGVGRGVVGVYQFICLALLYMVSVAHILICIHNLLYTVLKISKKQLYCWEMLLFNLPEIKIIS